LNEDQMVLLLKKKFHIEQVAPKDGSRLHHDDDGGGSKVVGGIVPDSGGENLVPDCGGENKARARSNLKKSKTSPCSNPKKRKTISKPLTEAPPSKKSSFGRKIKQTEKAQSTWK